MVGIDASELKEYIIENNSTPKILESLKCHSIKEYSTEWRCALPDGTNKTAVCVKKSTLSTAIRTSEMSEGGDIYTLVMKINGVAFGQAIKFIHETLGLKQERHKKKTNEPKQCPLDIFKKVKKKRYTINQDEIPVYDETIIREYVPLLYIGWAREGVMPFAAERFNVGFSLDRRRVVIPERKWDGGDNDYIGITGRTVVENYEMLGIPKFFKLSNTYPKGMNVYGLNENYGSIQRAGIVTVLEAQKSVLKRYSRKDETCVSIGGCELTDEQVKILISLNVDIVLAFDEGIDINHIRKECDKFYSIRNISYMYDRWGLIEKGSKDSPADMPNKIWSFLYKHRTIYCEKERKEFKSWQEKQEKN